MIGEGTVAVSGQLFKTAEIASGRIHAESPPVNRTHEDRKTRPIPSAGEAGPIQEIGRVEPRAIALTAPLQY